MDTLALYDSQTGAVKRYPLPGTYLAAQLTWSSDGGRIGVRLADGDAAAFWVLEIATGKLTKAGEFKDQSMLLERVLPDGSVVVRQYVVGPPVLVLAPDGAQGEWQPGRAMLPPGPLLGLDWSRAVPGEIAFTGGGALEIHAFEGAVYRWKAEGVERGYVSASQDRRWAAVQVHEGTGPGSVIFLSR